ncbi:MAG: response regulator [Verrucomicrobia bacterium]|nr:response regulator [Verrucomicrobiota bacterium]
MGFGEGNESLYRFPGAAFILGPEGRIAAWNLAAARLLGWSTGRVLGQPWWANLHAQLQIDPARDLAAAGTADQFTREYLVNRPDGDVAWFEFSYLRLPPGTPLGGEWLVWVAPRPSEAESPADPSGPPTALLAKVCEAVQEAVVVLDAERRVLLFNPAAEQACECACGTVLGQHAENHPTLAAILALLEAAVPSGEARLPRPAAALQVQRPSGGMLAFEGQVRRVKVGGGEYTVAILRDVTLREQRQQAILQSQKMLAIGSLASGVAHDFNNLLTAILSHLDLVSSAPELPDSLKESLTYAQTSARRGAELVSKLLAYSRHTEAQIDTLSLHDITTEVVAMLRHSIDRRIQIRHEALSPDLWPVRGDSSQLLQVVMNLCLNARDAMPRGGDLSLRLQNVHGLRPDASPGGAADDYVRLSVSDTGAGMAPEVRDRLFEPYFTTKAAGKGTGLGLSISYSIVTEHGGWIEVQSAPGAGSHFHVFLPRARQVQETAPEAQLEPPTLTIHSLEGSERILVVDDDEMVRLVVRAVLTYRGYQITEAADGEEAVRKFSEAPQGFDLVLLDLNMPRISGWEAMARLRELNPRIAIILLSGDLTESELERALKFGAVEFLNKPFDNPDLVRFVRRVLDERRRSSPA